MVAVLVFWLKSKIKREVGPGKCLVVVLMDCMDTSPDSGTVVFPDAGKVV